MMIKLPCKLYDMSCSLIYIVHDEDRQFETSAYPYSRPAQTLLLQVCCRLPGTAAQSCLVNACFKGMPAYGNDWVTETSMLLKHL
jgi:hypothetical protein